MCFFFKQKTAYEMRISDWSSDVCSSDLFHLLLAPILDLNDRAVRGIRACLYWQHPRFGRIDEDELLRAGARAGLIGDLELWQITHVCEHHLSARERGLPVLPFIIDISGWQLRSGEFAQHVEDLLARYEVPGDRLILALRDRKEHTSEL